MKNIANNPINVYVFATKNKKQLENALNQIFLPKDLIEDDCYYGVCTLISNDEETPPDFYIDNKPLWNGICFYTKEPNDVLKFRRECLESKHTPQNLMSELKKISQKFNLVLFILFDYPNIGYFDPKCENDLYIRRPLYDHEKITFGEGLL